VEVEAREERISKLENDLAEKQGEISTLVSRCVELAAAVEKAGEKAKVATLGSESSTAVERERDDIKNRNAFLEEERDRLQLLVVELEDELHEKTMLSKFISRMKSLGRPQSLQPKLYGNKSAKSEFKPKVVKQHLTGSARPGYLLTEKQAD
jgi:predicted RNase H-like nuclease (RuvC/YqgF family)